VSREEVDVRVRGHRIEVVGEKRPDTAGDVSYLCVERSFGKFHRAFDVSGSVNLARMTAVLKGGVLILSLPKVSERRGQERRIPVVTEG
jgi:HSP20 family protein